MPIYGYARVSTDGQTLDAQREALRLAGASKVFSEKESGARTDRPQLAKAIDSLQSGDTLIVTRLDRFARSTRDVLNMLKVIDDKGAAFKSLNETWADTTNDLSKLLTVILSGVAEFERGLINKRTNEGRIRAKANGVKFGPKFKLTPHQRQEVIARKEAGEFTRDIAKSYNVSHMTIVRLRP